MLFPTTKASFYAATRFNNAASNLKPYWRSWSLLVLAMVCPFIGSASTTPCELNSSQKTACSVASASLCPQPMSSISPALSATSGPVSLTYATYFGQSINNSFNDVAVDASGNSYAFGTTINQGFDAVLVKFDPSGTLLWQQFLGGSDAENFNSNDNKEYGKIALDNAGNIYVSGITQSTNFPTLSPFQASKAGGIDAFVAKFDADGNLLLSSYLGGPGDENLGGAGGIAVDQSGNIFVSGSTTATAFFNSGSGAQSSFSGGTATDAFVVKISADFSTVTGTYWGDEEVDVIRDLAASANGTIWAAGYSENSGLSLSGEQTINQGDRDGLLIALDNDLSSISAGTFFGGQFDDVINGVSTDVNNNVYITGSTFSTTDFPTQNGFQNAYTGGQEGFAAKLNSSAQTIWSSFLGGGQNELGLSITVDASANVYVGGITSSFDFPIARTVQETYNTLNCEHDAFIFKFNADGTRDWASFYGGWRSENPNGIAVNNLDQVIVVGKTESTDLPVTPGAHLTVPPVTGVNAFLSIFEITCPSTPVIIHSTENALFYEQFWCSNYERPENHHFAEDSCAVLLIGPPGYSSYSWIKNGSPISGASGQYHTIRDPGSNGAQFEMIVENGHGCADASTSIPIDAEWVRPMCGFGSSFDENELPHLSTITEGNDAEIYCSGDVINFPLSANGFCGAEFQWQKDFEDIPGAIDPNYSVTEPGCYRVGVQNGFTGCTVYSVTKKFVLLDSIRLNDHYTSGVLACEAIDTLVGCASVYIRARIPHCSGCYLNSNKLTYTFFLDGVQVAQNTNGRHNTSAPGDYVVEVSNGNCTLSSNNLHVKIQPTEPPIWVSPTTTPVCIYNSGPITFAVTHPAATDSSTIRFDFPYPFQDIIGYDSLVVVDSLFPGCMNARITTKNGCTSNSQSIELHDTLTPKIIPNGPTCIPVQLRPSITNGCTMDTMYWYWGDSLLRQAHYTIYQTATEPGPYILRVKNACGDFVSDTIFLKGNLPTPTISPVGPVCLPANLEVTLPVPDSNIIVHWYFQNNDSGCNTNNNNLIPDQNDPTLIANAPGYYFAVLEDTITGCTSSCTELVEVQRSVAGANISPSNNIYFCDGSGVTDINLYVSPASPSFSYQWYRNSAPISGETSNSYTATMPGVYRVYLENSCDNAFTPVVSIYNIANPTLTINRPDTVYLCGPDTIRMSTTSDQPLIYQWYKDGLPITDEIDSIYLATTPGIYEVLGINNNTQCEDYSQEINLIAGPEITAVLNNTPSCQGPCSGSIEAVVSGGVPFPNGSYIYNWSNGETTALITGLCTNTFTLTVTDATGCSTAFSATVEEGFSINTTIDSISCFELMDGKITTNLTGGQAPFSYHWNITSDSSIIEQLGAGNYTLTVTDDLNCSSSISVDLSDPTPLSMQLSSAVISCAGETDGTINGTFSGAHPPYTYSWSSPVILDSAMLAPGNYILTLSDQNSCALIDSVAILSPDSLLVSINITNGLSCPGDTDGSLETVVTGGTGVYIYNWENGDNTPHRTGLIAGIYNVTVTDENNCTSTASVQLSGTTVLAINSLSVSSITCHGADNGGIIFEGSGGLPPYEYIVNGLSQTSNHFDLLPPGNYSLQLIDANQCTSAIIDTSINEPQALTLNLTADSISCQGAQDGLINALANGGSPPYQFDWDQSVNLGAQELAPGMYHVTLSDDHACSLIDSIELFEPNSLSAIINITAAIQCAGGNSGALSLSIQGGTSPYTYQWAHGPTSNVLNNLVTGNYEVTVTDANNCTIAVDQDLGSPTALNWSFTVNNSSCNGADDGSIIFSTNGGTAPYEYLLNGASSTNSIFNNLAPGNYSLQVNDANNCLSALIDTLVTEPNSLSLQLTGENISCFAASDGEISALVTGGTEPYQYTWDTPVELDAAMLEPGTYRLTLSDANHCEIIDSISLSQPFALSGTIQLTQALLCHNEPIGALATTVLGGTSPYIYNWNNGESTANLSDLGAGTFDLTITDSNQCTFQESITLDQPASLAWSAATTPVSCFEGNDGSLTFTATGGTEPYQYLVNDIASNNVTQEELFAGDYNLQIIDANNCASEINTLAVETPAVLQATVDAVPIDCANKSTGSADIAVTGGVGNYDFVWENGLNSNSETNLGAGIYTVTINDQNDCPLEISFEIAIPALIQTEFETLDNVCADDEEGEVIVMGSTGGTAPYQWYLDEDPMAANRHKFNRLPAGTFLLTTVDALGCEIYQELTIMAPAKMVANLGEDMDIVFGEENSIHLDILNPGPEASVVWSPLDYLECEVAMDDNCYSPRIVLPEQNMIYEVLVTDENGCQAVDNIQVRVSRMTNPLYLGNSFSPNGDGVNDSFFVQAHSSIETISKFHIYDRWGALIFSRENFIPNNPDFGWDGRQNGIDIAPGVYIYAVEYILRDGKRGATNGDVLIIR